jgi:hypothetical protein
MDQPQTSTLVEQAAEGQRDQGECWENAIQESFWST